MTVSPGSMVSFPWGVMIRPPRLMQATSRLSVKESCSKGMPVRGASLPTRNSRAYTRLATILYRVSTLLPMEFCMART